MSTASIRTHLPLQLLQEEKQQKEEDKKQKEKEEEAKSNRGKIMLMVWRAG